MKKFKNIMLIIALIGTILLTMTVKVKAEDVLDVSNLVETVEITSPTTGSYQTGQVITFVVTFEKEAPTGLDMESLVIKFSESADKTITSGVANGKTITYQYTVEGSDKGQIKSYDFTARKGTQIFSAIADFEGNNITVNKEQGGTTKPGEYTWTDASKIKMSLTKVETTGKYYDVVLNITGLEKNKDYYFYVVSGTTKPTVTTETNGRINNATFSITGNQNTEIKKTLRKDMIEKNGDIHVWIYETQKDTINIGNVVNECIVLGTKMQRPIQNKLGSRMLCYFFSNYTSSYVYEPVQEHENRKINLKIGTVTDQSILRAIKNGDADCLTKLLNYAKSAKSPTYTGTIGVGSNEKSITGNMKLVDQQYYYVYMTLEGENGTYYPVEDVSLYQARIGEEIGKNLWDYLDSNFKWNLSDEEPNKPSGTQKPADKDNTTATGKLPQTGINTVIIILAIGVTIVGAVVGARKYKEYNIKY